jgi:hypothetical protein
LQGLSSSFRKLLRLRFACVRELSGKGYFSPPRRG